VLRFALVGSAIILALAGRAGAAVADGDPASDLLVGADVTLPFPVPSAKAAAPLLAHVDSCTRPATGSRLPSSRRARISARSRACWDIQRCTRTFLGVELSTIYVGPLLIVMPTGFGIYDGGRSTAAEQRVVARLHVVGAQADDLTPAATTAVAMLLTAEALKSKDTHAPIAYPAPSLGRRGQPMRLNYQVSEDSERSSVVVSVLAGSHRIASFGVPLRRVKPQATYFVTWRVPQTLPMGSYALCVSARDASGNQGRRSCMALQIS
jgi:hypothetical protein